MRKIFLLALLMALTPALASPKPDGKAMSAKGDKAWLQAAVSSGQLALAQANGKTLAEAIEMVRRQYKGRIVGAETVVKGNREEHQIRVLTEDGKVRTVRVPGRVLPRGRA